MPTVIIPAVPEISSVDRRWG